MEAWAAHLAWVDPWLLPAWTAWGIGFSWLECVACTLSLAMVACNLRVHPAGWPLAMVSSLLYGLLFARSRLYGEAALQLVFIAMSAWGWRQWRHGRLSADGANAPLYVRSMTPRARWATLACLLVLWPAAGALLGSATDSDVPFWDALPTVGSLIGQWLLGRKHVENWPCWLAVNLVSMALFAHKQLWLTVWVYAVFAVLSAWGWRVWSVQARRATMGRLVGVMP